MNPNWAGPTNSKRSDCIKQLAKDLVWENIQARVQEVDLPFSTRSSIELFCKSTGKDSLFHLPPEVPLLPVGVGRCHVCIQQRKISRTRCAVCQRFVCATHQVKNIKCEACNLQVID